MFASGRKCKGACDACPGCGALSAPAAAAAEMRKVRGGSQNELFAFMDGAGSQPSLKTSLRGGLRHAQLKQSMLFCGTCWAQ